MHYCTDSLLEGVDLNDGKKDELPPLRSCYSATTAASVEPGGALPLTRTRRASFRGRIESDVSCDSLEYSVDDDERTVGSCGGSVFTYTSLRGGTSYSDADEEETIDSRKVYHTGGRMATIEEKDNAANHLCCSLEGIVSEIEGTWRDGVKSFKQVLHAFAISPKDVDDVADTIRHAKGELLEMELERRWESARKFESML